MITVQTILDNHPEFFGCPEIMIQTAIDDAIVRVDPNMYLKTVDQAVRLLACHHLALSPYGQQARLVSADGTTTYKLQFNELRGEAAIGFRVV